MDMKPMRIATFVLLLGMVLVTAPGVSEAAGRASKDFKRDRASKDFKSNDTNGDGKLSRDEWLRRGNFEKLDVDEDGYLNLKEMRVHYRGALEERETGTKKASRGERRRKGRKGERRKTAEKSSKRSPDRQRSAVSEQDPRALEARVKPEALDEETLCAISRARRCGNKPAIKRGFFATGLGPRFPENADCHGIDDYYAQDYSYKRKGEFYHGGIDLPARWGTPIIAAAAGTVVAKYRGEDSARGIEITLRHSPENTGIPVWIYTQYAHLDEMPKQGVGQRVRMGEVLGPTGNSGIDPKTRVQSTRRRPAIHFAAWYSTSEHYTEQNDIIIPVDGYWMDPNALYRKTLPIDSPSMKALPEAEKGVPISIMFEDGKAFPADTKIVWPYRCKRE